MPSLDPDIFAWLRQAGLADADERPSMAALTGGVSSDVFLVDLRRGPVCVKRAIAQLRVSSDWRVPVARSDYEVAWLRTVRSLDGPIVPEVLAHDPEASRFAMTWFPPDRYSVWKSELACGHVSPEFAARVGSGLVAIHARTAGSPEISAKFATDDLFDALRIEPYLRYTAAVHTDLASRLEGIASEALAHKLVLVHGDVSPKNILVGPDGPVFLDAECAWFGDPAFDIAFCCTHLLLKALWLPAYRSQLLGACEALRESYFAGVRWEAASALDARAGSLLAALLLARVDGKSPVEYLGGPEKAFARDAARRFLSQTHLSLQGVGESWREQLERS